MLAHIDMRDEHDEFEALVASLNDIAVRDAYRTPLDTYQTGRLPRFLAGILVTCGSLVYGETPSYQKFRAVEVIARVPYHSWASAIFTLLTLFCTDEARALRLSTLSRFTRFAADNETMHVVVISALAHEYQPAGFFRHTFIPVAFAFFYFWISYFLYLLYPRWSLETNFLFEQHAFEQYSRFLAREGEELRRRPITSEFLRQYGRHPRSQYEFFESVRNDELIHRNRSIRELELHRRRGA